MQRLRKKFASGRRHSSKILHGCPMCGTSTYLSPFMTHNGSNFCVCGRTLQQVSKKQARGVL